MIVIVGAGPAGLTAAADLARRNQDVLVVEREAEAGGIPRHSNHLGYGIRDRHRFMTGPAYARRLTAAALHSGARIRTSTMVTGWGPSGALQLTSAHGREEIAPDALILATGARERPRPARLVPGDRPAGVLTTGQLQNLVHLHHREIGRRAVVIGAELVSWSAVLTLRHAGCRTVLMTSAYRRPESYAALPLLGRPVTRVARNTQLIRVIGKPRVEAVELETDGRRHLVECDTVVFTGDWIPDHELSRVRGLAHDHNSKAPIVDAALRTDGEGIFAAGNLVHPVDTADVAALDGAHVALAVRRFLDGERPRPGVAVTAGSGLRWVSPGLWRPGERPPARRRLLAWSDELIPRPVVTVTQDGRRLARRRLPWPAAPGRIFRIPSGVLGEVKPLDGPVTISLS